MPKRIQMSRQAPWREANPDAIIVSRPTLYGNPFTVGDIVQVTAAGEIAMIPMTAEMAVACYRDLWKSRMIRDPADMPEDAAWVQRWYDALETLRGHDVACWCPVGRPCHGDILLELANPTEKL